MRVVHPERVLYGAGDNRPARFNLRVPSHFFAGSVFVRALSVLICLLLWQSASANRWNVMVNFQNIPAPTEVAEAFIHLVQSSKLLAHIWSSVARTSRSMPAPRVVNCHTSPSYSPGHSTLLWTTVLPRNSVQTTSCFFRRAMMPGLSDLAMCLCRVFSRQRLLRVAWGTLGARAVYRLMTSRGHAECALGSSKIWQSLCTARTLLCAGCITQNGITPWLNLSSGQHITTG